MISQKENKNLANAPLMQRQGTIDYIISDFNICDLPEQNPLSQCIDDFVSRRNDYILAKSKNLNHSIEKPHLDDFLKTF